MLEQKPSQNEKSSLDIEQLLKNELKDTVRYHIGRYSKTFEVKLGLTKDDLINDMREQIWKGLLTHDTTKTANLITYLSKIINNRFKTLYDRSRLQKYNSVDYYADVFAASGIDNDAITTEETAATVFERRQVISQDLESLSEQHRLVYESLLVGSSLMDMSKKLQISRVDLTGILKQLDLLIRERRG